MPRIGWRRTSIRLAALTSRPRRCCARLAHCHRKADLRWERRPARRAFERWSPAQGSAYSAGPRKRHSIWFLRLGFEKSTRRRHIFHAAGIGGGGAFPVILQVNFNLDAPAAEYQKVADSVAHAFLDVPGLRW